MDRSRQPMVNIRRGLCGSIHHVLYVSSVLGLICLGIGVIRGAGLVPCGKLLKCLHGLEHAVERLPLLADNLLLPLNGDLVWTTFWSACAFAFAAVTRHLIIFQNLNAG